MHLHKEVTETGIYLKIVTPEDLGNHPVDYVHRDDYYIFGLITRGEMCIDVDFERQSVREGEIGIIQPGQIHRFISGDNFEGLMLSVERSVVGDQYKLIFEEASLLCKSIELSNPEICELKVLFQLIYDMASRGGDLSVVRNLTFAFVGIIAGCFKRVSSQQLRHNSRHKEIVLQLNHLLQKHLAENHSPSFYADKLKLSSVYLNEVVKSVTGWNVSNYIRNEIILRAKRLLYHTNLTVKEIALSLGFDDNAYFTRLFTKAIGKSPLQFRAKH